MLDDEIGFTSQESPMVGDIDLTQLDLDVG